MVLVTEKKSLSCFLKSINIDITPYHIILMICMLLKVQYLNDYITVKYVISHSDVINAVSHFKKMLNQMGMRAYFLIIFFMLHIDFTLFYVFYTPCFYRMVLAQNQ